MAVKKIKVKAKKTETKPKAKKAKAKKMPAWEVYLNVMNPKINRPRRSSLHTLAYVCGYKNPLKLAKEMKDSGKVVGYVCPDVQTPIFYLKKLASHPGMIDTRDEFVWGKWPYEEAGAKSLSGFVKKNPFPKIKGFRRFADNPYWTGGAWGKGEYVRAGSFGMKDPYEPEDHEYGRAVIKALKKAGYKPRIKESDLAA